MANETASARATLSIRIPLVEYVWQPNVNRNARRLLLSVELYLRMPNLSRRAFPGARLRRTRGCSCGTNTIYVSSTTPKNQTPRRQRSPRSRRCHYACARISGRACSRQSAPYAHAPQQPRNQPIRHSAAPAWIRSPFRLKTPLNHPETALSPHFTPQPPACTLVMTLNYF
jgi:hypothetical protein